MALWLGCVGAGADVPDDQGQREALRLSQAAIGRSVSDWQLTDSSGRAMRLSELRGKPVVVSFMYTGCFQVCPTTTQFLKTAVQATRDALGAGSFRVISIGFNQPFDSPEALSDFAKKLGIRVADWYFVAPRTTDVPSLLAEFGLTVTPTTAGFDHIIQATIVDGDGVIYRQVYGDAFDLPMFIDPLKQLLSGQAERNVTLDNIWLKVKLFCTVYDPSSGRYKFNYSLFVELFAGLTFLGALIWYVVLGLRRRSAAASDAALDQPTSS
jgi:protein SCO1/2